MMTTTATANIEKLTKEELKYLGKKIAKATSMHHDVVVHPADARKMLAACHRERNADHEEGPSQDSRSLVLSQELRSAHVRESVLAGKLQALQNQVALDAEADRQRWAELVEAAGEVVRGSWDEPLSGPAARLRALVKKEWARNS